uniref:Rho guanine nucleotide exchange factor 15b n=1 Tax=Fundulus heteroclitus TaxID=8078 RepID=A0A3Q2TXP4_FUNHE
MERPTSPLNPDVKRRPEVPPRSLYSDSRSLAGGGSSSGAAQGQVKEIVRRITKQESIDAGEKLANGAAEPSPRKEVKTPPEVKPRPDVGPQPQAGTKLAAPLAPPLPKKRSRTPKKLTESDGVSTDGRRSGTAAMCVLEHPEAFYRESGDRSTSFVSTAPDGKEGAVQMSGAAEAKDEDTLYSTLAHYCSKNCTCMCHLQRPGMMLIWVPVEEHENERPGGTAREADVPSSHRLRPEPPKTSPPSSPLVPLRPPPAPPKTFSRSNSTASTRSTIFPGSKTSSNNGQGARGSVVPAVSQSTLWQELPAVRDSGMLDQLTADQIKYQEVRRRNFQMKTNGQFATVINRLQEQPQCQRLPFLSFLLLPFQRITRIKILIEVSATSLIIDQCNKDVGKMKQMEELIETSKMLEFDKLKAIPIISETRYLEKKGELQEMSKSKTFVNMRARFSVVYLFLFNDWLLITAKKSSDRYLVMDHAHRSLVQAQPLGECFGGGTTYENCFNLVMLENHQGRIRLSDGQKGWFPDANVIEITNEHVRRRNIKERYRVSQATRLAKNRSR